MEEKLFELMAQAEDLQKHAAKLQNEAQEVFSALPLAVEQAGRKIRSTGLLGALFVLAVGGVVATVAVAGIWWSTDGLREERTALKTAIKAEEARLAEIKTWGLRLEKNEKGRFIVLPKGTKIDERAWSVGDNPAIRLEN